MAREVYKLLSPSYVHLRTTYVSIPPRVVFALNVAERGEVLFEFILHTRGDADSVQPSEFRAKALRRKEDVRFIPCAGVGLHQMSRRNFFKVGAFTVVLTESGDEEVHPYEAVECECEDFHSRVSNIRCKTPEEHRCRHIREAIMFHHFAGRVEPVEAKQESLAAYSAPADD